MIQGRTLMQLSRQSLFSGRAATLFAGGFVSGGPSLTRADEPPTVRSQAVVNLSFDEAAGDALDSATAGSAKDNGVLQNGAHRVKSPFWGQSGKQALVLDSGLRQFVQIADSPDVDRPEAVSFSMFFVNLHPAADGGYHGVAAKRDEGKQITNYGINYAGNTDTFQVYINAGDASKAPSNSPTPATAQRPPVFITP